MMPTSQRVIRMSVAATCLVVIAVGLVEFALRLGGVA